ncbi:MAG TPA: response regulator [Gemmatimonadales bacterium]|nr:response regulator [Gemmatimonadales bacterium]
MAEAPGPRILIVDDDHTVARLVMHVVRSLGFGPATHVTTGREGLEAMDDADIVLLDHQLPDANGLDVLETVRARPHPPAVIVITAHGNESLAAAALRLGADDYLAKDHSLLELLPQVLERVRRNRELRKALAAAEQDLVRAERLAAAGELTVTLHHNINNPLMSASADLELLLAEPELPLAQRQQTLRNIQTALRRIRDLVRQVGDLRDVRTKAYLPGVRMVDLEAAGQPAAAIEPRGTALVLVAEEDLARVVDLLLRHAGFTVERCGSVDDLRQATGRLGLALVVVLGGTDAAGAHPLGGFDPPDARDWRLVALVAGDGTAARAAGADRVVELPFDPGSFTAEMIRLVSGAA